MIEILFDHSDAEEYYRLSHVEVNIKDTAEKERIENLVKKHELVGMLDYPDTSLREWIAKLLNVDANIIDFDTNEIDLI